MECLLGGGSYENSAGALDADYGQSDEAERSASEWLVVRQCSRRSVRMHGRPDIAQRVRAELSGRQ